MKTYIIKHTALLHNGKRYEPGDRIQLTDAEAENLALYLTLDEAAEQEAAEKEKAKAEAEQKAAAEKAKAAAEKAKVDAKAESKADTTK